MDFVVCAAEEGDDLGTVCGAYLYKTSFEGENETGFRKNFIARCYFCQNTFSLAIIGLSNIMVV